MREDGEIKCITSNDHVGTPPPLSGWNHGQTAENISFLQLRWCSVKYTNTKYFIYKSDFLPCRD